MESEEYDKLLANQKARLLSVSKTRRNRQLLGLFVVFLLFIIYISSGQKDKQLSPADAEELTKDLLDEDQSDFDDEEDGGEDTKINHSKKSPPTKKPHHKKPAESSSENQEQQSQEVDDSIPKTDKEEDEGGDTSKKTNLDNLEEEEEEGNNGDNNEEDEGEEENEIDPYMNKAECDDLLNKQFADTDIVNQVKLANCGGYKFPNGTNKNRAWKVVFYGYEFTDGRVRTLSGCPTHCPLNPRCSLTFTGLLSVAQSANVVVVFQNDYRNLLSIGKSKIRVLYWREAHQQYVPPNVQLKYADLEMGIHYQAQIINPMFMLIPHVLNGIPSKRPLLPRKKLAIFVASDCHTLSKRELYIKRLNAAVKGRVDSYGNCGDHQLPGGTVEKGRDIIQEYKFYLSFENTIQEGYVTEKLYHVMALQIVPVYYGGANPPNITKTPSYIRVDQFSSPEKLGEYLLYLDSHDDEYLKYHAWRKDPLGYDLEFLKKVQKDRPSKKEILAHIGIHNPVRAASCCRLCNAEFVQQAVEARKRNPKAVESPRDWKRIKETFFDGN